MLKKAKPLTHLEIIAGELWNNPEIFNTDLMEYPDDGIEKIHEYIQAAANEGRRQQREESANAIYAAIAILEPLRDALIEPSEEFTDANQIIKQLYALLEPQPTKGETQ